MKWWEETVFYEIYMPSFQDSNNDGFGDFEGIRSRLPYLSELGIGGIWLTPFYSSPLVDNGYDISDYKKIDSRYGTMQDFEKFISDAHALGIRIIADLVINHTSTRHDWFKESRLSRNSPKRDWYIWQDAPNNWESFFGGSAWEWDEHTKSYYYHSFSKEQADLNWNNPEVKDAVKDIMDFWLKKGIDGFRLDVINNLTVSKSFENNPYDEEGNQLHLHDKDQEGLIAVLRELQEYILSLNPDAFTIGEISSDDLSEIEVYSRNGLLDVTFNFNFGSISTFSIEDTFQELVKMNKVYQNGRTPTLFFGSHDMGRMWSRLANESFELYKLLSFLLLTAKGVPFLYFGEEIGMRDVVQTKIEDFRDIQALTAYQIALESGKGELLALKIANKESRDKARAPMQWLDKPFTNGEPWLKEAPPVSKENQSIFAHYQKLIQVRRETRLFEEPCTEMVLSNEFLHFRRGPYYVVLNFSEIEQSLLFPEGKFEIYYQTTKELKIEGEVIILGPLTGVLLKVGENK